MSSTIWKRSCALSMVIILALSVFSCTGDPEQDLPESVRELENVTIHEYGSEPSYSLSLNRLLTITDSEEVLFGRIGIIEVDEADRIYIREGARENLGIYVFDSEGTYLTKIGRSGDGPGEFRSIMDLKIHDNQLFAVDGSLFRLQIFELDTFSLVREIPIDPTQLDQPDNEGFWIPTKVHVLNDDTLLMTFMNLTSGMITKSYYKLNLDGDVMSDRIMSIDHINQLSDPVSGSVIFDPFSGIGRSGISADNKFYTTFSDEMLFRVYDTNGNYLRAFYHPFNHSSLSRNEALNFHDSESFRRALQHNGIPDKWRAFENMVLDDENRIWVSTITDDKDTYEWWVMESDGTLLAKKELPRSVFIQTIIRNHVYTVKLDDDTSQWQVGKYEIELR